MDTAAMCSTLISGRWYTRACKYVCIAWISASGSPCDVTRRGETAEGKPRRRRFCTRDRPLSSLERTVWIFQASLPGVQRTWHARHARSIAQRAPISTKHDHRPSYRWSSSLERETQSARVREKPSEAQSRHHHTSQPAFGRWSSYHERATLKTRFEGKCEHFWQEGFLSLSFSLTLLKSQKGESQRKEEKTQTRAYLGVRCLNTMPWQTPLRFFFALADVCTRTYTHAAYTFANSFGVIFDYAEEDTQRGERCVRDEKPRKNPFYGSYHAARILRRV